VRSLVEGSAIEIVTVTTTENGREEAEMNARQKLNSGHVNGALLVAGLVGGFTGSWTIFGLALAGLVITKLIGGDIRLKGRKR
jgi:hypothetical protein